MPGADVLSSYPYVVVRIACRRCTRKGSYRLARLAAKYNAEIPMMELLAHLAGDCAAGTPATPQPRAAAPTSSTSTFLPRPQTGPQKACGASGPKPNRQETRLPLEGTTGCSRLIIDANPGLRIEHDPTIRTPPKSTPPCASVRSPQRTDGVLLKPSYFTTIAHCLQESVFDDGWPRNVDYA